MDAVADGQRVAALFGDASDRPASVDLYAVLADSARALLARRQDDPGLGSASPR